MKVGNCWRSAFILPWPADLLAECVENSIRVALIEDAIGNTARAIEDRFFIRILEGEELIACFRVKDEDIRA